jgi:hypothetical protein
MANAMFAQKDFNKRYGLNQKADFIHDTEQKLQGNIISSSPVEN